MAQTVTHKYVSTVTEGGGSGTPGGTVGPTEWNAAHLGAIAVFNVMTDFGAVGDGVTDDTTAINKAIAALNTATQGTLYFPPGVYLVTGGSLTTITAQYANIYGDNSGSSILLTSSQTGVLINYIPVSSAPSGNPNNPNINIANLTFNNTAASAPTSGAAVVITHATLFLITGTFVNLTIDGFFDGFDDQISSSHFYYGCTFQNCVRYNTRIRDINNIDQDNSTFFLCGWGATTRNSTAGIQWESSGNFSVIKGSFYGISGTGTGLVTAMNFDLASFGTTATIFIESCNVEDFITAGMVFTNLNRININNVELNLDNTNNNPVVFNSCQNCNISNVTAFKTAGSFVHILDFTSTSSIVNFTNIQGNDSSKVSGVTGLVALAQRNGIEVPITGSSSIANLLAFGTGPGQRYVVTDSTQTAPTLGQAVVSGDEGGSHTYPVYADGSAWRYG